MKQRMIPQSWYVLHYKTGVNTKQLLCVSPCGLTAKHTYTKMVHCTLHHSVLSLQYTDCILVQTTTNHAAGAVHCTEADSVQ